MKDRADRGFGSSGSCAAILEGGADTSSMYIRTLVLLLVAFPDVQKKAQEEIDIVIGVERAPILQDFVGLPYVQALVKEVNISAIFIWPGYTMAHFILDSAFSHLSTAWSAPLHHKR